MCGQWATGSEWTVSGQRSVVGGGALQRVSRGCGGVKRKAFGGAARLFGGLFGGLFGAERCCGVGRWWERCALGG